MHFHGKNMANAYDFIDKSVLPEEYLPDDYTGPSAGPEKQIIGKKYNRWSMTWKMCFWGTLRKHAYSNILKIFPPKNENFQIKKSDIFHISARNIDCGYSLEPPWWGGSNEYHNLCFEQKYEK